MWKSLDVSETSHFKWVHFLILQCHGQSGRQNWLSGLSGNGDSISSPLSETCSGEMQFSSRRLMPLVWSWKKRYIEIILGQPDDHCMKSLYFIVFLDKLQSNFWKIRIFSFFSSAGSVSVCAVNGHTVLPTALWPPAPQHSQRQGEKAVPSHHCSSRGSGPEKWCHTLLDPGQTQVQWD